MWQRIINVWQRTVNVVCLVGAGSAVAMMLLTTVDVLFRYVLAKPLIGAVEGATYLQATLVFCAAAMAQLKGRHVAVSFLTLRFPATVRRSFSVLVPLLLLGLGLVLTWKTGEQAYASWQVKEYESAATPFLPVWPVRGILTAGCFMLSLQFLAELVQSIKATPMMLRTKEH